MAKTKAQLTAENNSNFPNNNSQFITPEKLRGFNQDMIDSTVNQDIYTADSASFNTRIDNIDTGSLLLTASFDNGTREMTFTKADNTTFDISIPAGTAVLPSGVVSGSSQVILTDTSGNLGGNRITGSVSNATNAVSSSHSEVADEVPYVGVVGKPTLVSGSSQIDYTGISNVPSGIVSSSSQVSFSGITGVPSGLVSGSSQITLTDTSGNLGGNRITGSVSNATNAVSASYSSTSEWSGLIGKPSGIVSSSAQVSNLTGSLLTTASNDFSQITFTKGDASTFQLDVTPRRVVETVKNKNGFMPKGTPVYVSGSTGNELHVYQADAGDPTKVPATFILDQALNTDESGLGILSGFINGVDTSGFAEGANIYLAVGGGYTDTQPTGSAFVQKLGNVVKSDLNGSGVISGAGRVNALPNIAQDKVWVGDSNGVPQEISKNNLGLALTGSNNTFTGTQTFDNIAVNGTGSFAYIQSITGSAKIIGDAFIVLNNNTPTERYAGLSVYDSGSAGVTASFQFDGLNNNWFYEYSTDGGVTTDHGVTLFGPEYSDKGTPSYPSSNVIQKGTGGHHLTGSNISDSGTLITLNSNTQVNGNFEMYTGTFTILDNIQSLSGVISAPNGSFNNINSYTSSNDSKVNSLINATGSYATTGSNNFVGNQSITGSLIISSSNSTDFTVVGRMRMEGPGDSGSTSPLFTFASPSYTSTLRPYDIKLLKSDGIFAQQSTTFGGFFSAGTADATEVAICADGATYTNNWTKGPALSVNDPANNFPAVFGFQNKTNWTDGRVTVLKPFVANDIVSSSADVYGVTGHFSGIDVGTLEINGGTIISGSVKTEVAIQSISSQTASIDFTNTSLFELTLGNGVDTRIEASNVGKGQTLNVLITQNGTSAGTVSFSSAFLQPSGSEYVPTTTLGGQDILTLMTYNDTSKIYVVATNKFE